MSKLDLVRQRVLGVTAAQLNAVIIQEARVVEIDVFVKVVEFNIGEVVVDLRA